MKKLIILIVVLFSCLSLSGCAENSNMEFGVGYYMYDSRTNSLYDEQHFEGMLGVIFYKDGTTNNDVRTWKNNDRKNVIDVTLNFELSPRTYCLVFEKGYCYEPVENEDDITYFYTKEYYNNNFANKTE